MSKVKLESPKQLYIQVYTLVYAKMKLGPYKDDYEILFGLCGAVPEGYKLLPCGSSHVGEGPCR